MTRRRPASLAAALLVPVAAAALSGCESSQSKSARLAAEAAKVTQESEQGLAVTTPAKDITAVDATVVSDENGTAVAVRLRNAGTLAVDVPVLVKVTDAAGNEVFTNDTPGIERSLSHAPVVPRGRTWWVNDQVPVPLEPGAKAEVVVGEPEGDPKAAEPTFTLTDPVIEQDPASGWYASGKLSHDQPDELRRVLVTAVGLKDGAVVTAGTGVVQRARAGKRAGFRAFLIGAPQGAELQTSAAPNLEAR